MGHPHPAYAARLEPKLSPLIDQCQDAAAGESTKFEFIIQITKEGRVKDGNAVPRAKAADCLFLQIRRINDRDQPPFPPPPSDGYWLKFDMDSQHFSLAAK